MSNIQKKTSLLQTTSPYLHGTVSCWAIPPSRSGYWPWRDTLHRPPTSGAAHSSSWCSQWQSHSWTDGRPREGRLPHSLGMLGTKLKMKQCYSTVLKTKLSDSCTHLLTPSSTLIQQSTSDHYRIWVSCIQTIITALICLYRLAYYKITNTCKNKYVRSYDNTSNDITCKLPQNTFSFSWKQITAAVNLWYWRYMSCHKVDEDRLQQISTLNQLTMY